MLHAHIYILSLLKSFYLFTDILHDHDQKLDLIERLGDLAPPSHPAFHLGTVLPEGDLRIFTLDPLPQPRGERLAI